MKLSMFKDEYHPEVKKDLKKLDLAIRTKIKTQYIPKILSNPKIGETLVGDLKGIFSYHFRAFKQQYRIAYVVNPDSKKVFVLMIGKRGDFYTLLKRRI